MNAGIAYPAMKNDSLNGIRLFISADSLRKIPDYDNARILYNEAKNIFEQIQCWDKVMAIHRNTAWDFIMQGKMDSAQNRLNNTLTIGLLHQQNNTIEFANAHVVMGIFFDIKGDYENAQDYFEKGLKLQTKIFGEDNLYVAATYQNLGVSCRKRGMISEALEYYNKSIKIRREKLGNEHADVGWLATNMAVCYMVLKEYDNSQKILDMAIKTLSNAYSNEHPVLLNALGNYSLLMIHLNDFHAAHNYLNKAFAIIKKNNMEEYPAFIELNNGYGSLYRKEKKYIQALEHYQKSLNKLFYDFESDNLYLNPDMPNESSVKLFLGDFIIDAVHGKADAFWELYNYSIHVSDSVFDAGYNEMQNANYKVSIDIYNHAWDLYEHSNNYAGIAKCNNWIAWNHIHLSEFNVAIDKLLKNMNFIVTNNLKGNLEEAVCLGMLGVAHKDMGFYKQALEYYEQELKIKINLLGETHLRVAATYANMAVAYRKYGNMNKAIEYEEKAMKLYFNQLGDLSPQLAMSYNNIAANFYDMGDYELAKDFYEKSLRIYLHIYGNDGHPDIALCYFNLGAIENQLNEYNNSKINTETALRIRKKFYPENHLLIAYCYENLGAVYGYLNMRDSSFFYYNKSISIYENINKNYFEIERVFSHRGVFEVKTGNYEIAIKYFKKVQEIYNIYFSKNHPKWVSLYNNIGIAFLKSGNYKFAIDNFHLAIIAGTTSADDCSLGDIFMNPSLKELKFDLNLIDALDNKADAFYHQFLTKK